MACVSNKDSKQDCSLEYVENRDTLYVESATSSRGGSDPKAASKPKMGAKEKSEKAHVEQEKRLRREIANSNERRRMLAINSGFESLKTLLPHVEGDKLSKAAILHQTTDYITAMESEKTRLLAQNAKLKEQLLDLGINVDSDAGSNGGSPPPKRKKRDTESSDEGIGLTTGDFDDPSTEDLKKEMLYLRCQLDRERRLRMMLEEQTRNLEAQLYPERLRQIATQVHAQMRYQEEKEKYLEEQRKIQEEQESALAARQSAATNRTQPPPVATPPVTASPAPVIATPMEVKPCIADTPVIKHEGPPTPIQAATPALPTPPAKRQQSSQNPVSSMSRRNLETIVEAIRHLEGDSIDFDIDGCKMERKEEQMELKSTDSDDAALFASSSSEQDDCHSDNSGRDSPIIGNLHMMTSSYSVNAATTTVQLPEHHPHNSSSILPHLPQQHNAVGVTVHPVLPCHSPVAGDQYPSSDRYPVATQLLQQTQYVSSHTNQRPAVIVHNLS